MIESLWAAQQQEIKSITPVLMDIKQTNANIESSIALLTSQSAELSKKVTHLEHKIKESSESIAVLEDKIEGMQLTLRKANFEIKNVPKKANETKEDLVEMVLRLSTTIRADLNKADINKNSVFCFLS